MLQSCDDDGYSIGDFSWDWATVRATGGGGYYLEGDNWGVIDPVATSIPWFKPVDGERVVAFFNPLYDMEGGKGVQVKMEGIQELLTKEVEDMSTEEEAEEFGAFLADQGAEQCGYCSPGFIMNVLAMCKEMENPTDDEIREYLSGNLCRCSGYEGQLRAIHAYLDYKKGAK